MDYFLYFCQGEEARAVFVARMMVNLVERLSGNWNYDMRTTLPCGIDSLEEGDSFLREEAREARVILRVVIYFIIIIIIIIVIILLDLHSFDTPHIPTVTFLTVLEVDSVDTYG